jgi:hypothetical protein
MLRAGVNALSVSGSTTTTGQLQIQNTSTTAFQVQNNSSQTVLGVNTSTGSVLLGTPGASGVTGSLVVYNSTNSNTVTIQSGVTGSSYSLTLPTAAPSSNGQCLTGTTAGVLSFATCAAGHTKQVILTPEYAGAVLTNCTTTGGGACAGTDNNTGTVTSAWDNSTSDGGPGYMSYYNWTSTQANAQTYDVLVRVPIPSDWSSWTGTNLTIYYYDDNNTNTALSAQVVGYNGSVAAAP